MDRSHPAFARGFVAYVGPSRYEVVPHDDEQPEPFLIEDRLDYPLEYLLRLARKRERIARDEVNYLREHNLRRCAEFVCKTPGKRRRCTQAAGRKTDVCFLCKRKYLGKSLGIPLVESESSVILPMSNAAS